MTFFSALGAVFKGFFASIWDALRRRRQDRERVEAAHREAENASMKHAIKASKKARKVDDEIMADERPFDDLIDRL